MGCALYPQQSLRHKGWRYWQYSTESCWRYSLFCLILVLNNHSCIFYWNSYSVACWDLCYISWFIVNEKRKRKFKRSEQKRGSAIERDFARKIGNHWNFSIFWNSKLCFKQVFKNQNLLFSLLFTCINQFSWLLLLPVVNSMYYFLFGWQLSPNLLDFSKQCDLREYILF